MLSPILNSGIFRLNLISPLAIASDQRFTCAVQCCRSAEGLVDDNKEMLKVSNGKPKLSESG